MPATSTHKHPDGRTITFTEASHKYEDGQGGRYQSVTTWLKQFFKPFDAPRMAARVAKRDGREVADVVAEWNNKRDTACEFGTRTHEIAEAVLLQQTAPHQPRDERETRAFFLATDYAETLRTWANENGGQVYVERVVADPANLLAGTIDLQVDFADCTWLIDWKTNASLTKSYGKGRGPIKHLDDSNRTKYGLQLSTYETIIREHYNVNGPVFRRLVHIDHDGGRNFIDLPSFAEEVAAMLEARSPANA